MILPNTAPPPEQNKLYLLLTDIIVVETFHVKILFRFKTLKNYKSLKSFNKNFLLNCDKMSQVIKTCLFSMFSQETQLSPYSFLLLY